MDKRKKHERLAWLDDLRGLAACSVVFHHLFVVEIPVLFRSYWDERAEANRHWFQLPPFRLIISGQAMVRLFSILSGLTLSISFRRTREQGRHLRSAVWSAFLRRALRLYIPLFIWSLVSHVFWYFGFYGWDIGLTAGIYLISLPFDERKIPPDWSFARHLNLTSSKNDLLTQLCWYTIGSAMTVASIRNLPIVQRILSVSALQPLGGISYSMYLMHITVFYILRDPILNQVCYFLGEKNYWEIQKDGNEHVFIIAWIVATPTLLRVLLLSATMFTELVEKRTTIFAAKLDRLSQADAATMGNSTKNKNKTE